MSNTARIFNNALFAFNNGDLKRAEELFRRVVKTDKSDIAALNLLVVVLMRMERFAEAEPFIARATSLNTQSDVSFYNYGLISKRLNKPQQALENFGKAIAINPDIAETWNNRGTVLNDLHKYDLAISDFDKAILINRQYSEAYANKGKSLTLLKRYDEAFVAYDKALAIKPDLEVAWLGRGNVFWSVKRHDEAFAAYAKALAIKPDLEGAWLGRGNVFYDLKRYDEAFAAYDKALSIKPDLEAAWLGRARVFDRTRQHDKALLAYSQVQKINPQFEFIKGLYIHQKMLCCDWTNLSDLVKEIEVDIASDKKSAEPFGWQGISESERGLQLCAQIWNKNHYPDLSPSRRYAQQSNKIRLGYVSGEFRAQATSVLIVDLLETHNKSKFEVFAFDNGWDDASELRKRINGSVHKVIDISSLDDATVAKRISDEGIDILIDLNGYFGGARTRVFSYKSAPIQVNFLGFPGTLGANYIDYIVADEIVIPPTSRAFYDEKVVYLPHTYQPNDRFRVISETTKSRRELNLLEDSFVFCCFNNRYKITPATFTSWMNILSRVEKSTLWLLADCNSTVENLQRSAQQRGVDPARLTFAKRMSLADHLGRHRSADLFLDTLPYNAHTTASDALWAGLPVLTQIGNTFPGRVVASLLKAIDLPELITYSRDEYEALAIELALNKERLQSIREKLARNRLTTPLFNTPLYAKHLEAAYEAMYQRYQAGLAPDHIKIKPLNQKEGR